MYDTIIDCVWRRRRIFRVFLTYSAKLWHFGAAFELIEAYDIAYAQSHRRLKREFGPAQGAFAPLPPGPVRAWLQPIIKAANKPRVVQLFPCLVYYSS